MKHSDWVLCGKWALVGGIVALGVMGLNGSFAQEKLARRLPPPEGWTVNAAYDQKDWPKMAFTATFQNVSGVQKSIKGTARLVRIVFKGNPMSRVLRPGDIERTEIEQKPFQLTLSAGGKKTLGFDFAYRPNDSEPKPSDRPVTYVLDLATDDGRQLNGASASAPRTNR